MKPISNMQPEERFTRTLFGIVMIVASFIAWGKWIMLVLGVLFLVSAWQGYCVTCEMYKKLNQKKAS